MHLVVFFVALLKQQVFKDEEQIVYSLCIELRVVLLICVQVVFWGALDLFLFQRVASHVYDCDCADSKILVPKVQLDEEMRLVVCRAFRLISRLFKVSTVLLYSF